MAKHITHPLAVSGVGAETDQPAAPSGFHSMLRARVFRHGETVQANGMRAILVDLLLLILFSIPAVLPLTVPGYLQGSDAVDPPWRSFVLLQAVKDGILVPRWSPDLLQGYGFPLFNFYAPLSAFPAILLNGFAGIDMVEGSKIAFGLNLPLAAIGGYLLARQVVGSRRGALLAGVLYMYSPFTLGEVYVRSNLPGSAGLGLLPFVVSAVARLCQRPSLMMSGVSAILLAALILTHNVTAVLGFGMIAGLVVLNYLSNRDGSLLVLAGIALVLGVGTAAFFWIPAVGEMPYVHTENHFSGSNDPHYHFVNPLGDVDPTIHERGWWEPYQISSWGPTDLHLTYPYGSPPYKLSLFQGLLALLSLVALVVVRIRNRNLPFLMLLALVMFFLHTSWSQWVWDNFKPIVLISYPWRLIGPVGLCIAVVGSWGVVAMARKWQNLLLLLVGVSAILSSLWMLPMRLGPYQGGDEVSRQSLIQYEFHNRNRLGTWADNQFLPASLKWENISSGDIILRFDQSFPAKGWVGDTAFAPPGSKAWILATRRGQQWMEAEVEAGEPTKIAFHTVYYPGWTAYLDGKQVDVEPSSWQEYEYGRRAALGVVQVNIPAGTHVVKVVFEDTALRRWSNSISALSALGIGMILLTALGLRGGVQRRWRGRAGLIALCVIVLVSGYLTYHNVVASNGHPWVEHKTVFDMVEVAREDGLQLMAPSGAKADDYIHPRFFNIQGEARPVVYMHPPSSAATRLWLPKGATLKFAIGIDPAVWDKPGDGVEFQVAVRVGEKTDSLFSSYIDPKAKSEDRRWVTGTVDLGAYAHKEVELIFSTHPGASADYDWAGWGTARVVAP